MGVADPEYLISQMTPLPRTEGWAVRTFTHPVALVAELAAWSELAQGASEPNPFYEPWFFLPALKALADHDSEWRIIVLEQTVKNRTHWAGFFPFQITDRGGAVGLETSALEAPPVLSDDTAHRVGSGARGSGPSDGLSQT